MESFESVKYWLHVYRFINIIYLHTDTFLFLFTLHHHQEDEKANSTHSLTTSSSVSTKSGKSRSESYTDDRINLRERFQSYGSLTSLDSVKTLEEDPFIFDLSSSTPFSKKAPVDYDYLTNTNDNMSRLEMQSLLSNDEKKTLDENNITWPRRNVSAVAMSNPLQPLQSLFRPRSNSFDSHITDSMHRLLQDVDIKNHFDTIIAALDQMEDDFDQQTYEELIPFQIRMALENQIHGWDHTYSVLLGHIILPLIGYAIMYYSVSVIGLRNVQCDETSSKCIWHKIENSHPRNYDPIFGLSWTVFRLIRALLSMWSAVSVFRTIRRRRKVWLHRQKAEYFKHDTAAHQDIVQADRNSLLGKIRGGLSKKRDNWRKRRIQTQISRAEKRFERRQESRRREFQDGSVEYESEHHRRVQILSKRLNRSALDDNNSTTTGGSQMQSYDDSFAVDDVLSDIGDDSIDFLDTYQKYRRFAKEECQKHDSGENIFYGHTMPAFAMQSISKDQIRFGGMINNLAYAHGGFFGAAPFMLANPHWYVLFFN